MPSVWATRSDFPNLLDVDRISSTDDSVLQATHHSLFHGEERHHVGSLLDRRGVDVLLDLNNVSGLSGNQVITTPLAAISPSGKTHDGIRSPAMRAVLGSLQHLALAG